MSLPLSCTTIGMAWLLLYSVILLAADVQESIVPLISQLWFIAAFYFLYYERKETKNEL